MIASVTGRAVTVPVDVVAGEQAFDGPLQVGLAA